MSAPLPFQQRFLAIIIPTPAQYAIAFVTSSVMLVLAHSKGILEMMEINSDAVNAVNNQFHAFFDGWLQSPIISQIAVMAFWAAVGLVAYLICWAGYNALIEARNEVTLKTAYTNRGPGSNSVRNLGIKAVAAGALLANLALLQVGIMYWFNLFGRFSTEQSYMSVVWALLAVFGMAAQLYLVLACIQLTFTPWYRAEAFTEAS
ncbi:hypothetical protein IPG36_01205 [bacterium]|nr:MAG: hypothetical protein IPG36_01205 [bacterium]